MPVESFAQPAPSTVPRRRPFGPVHRCGGTETVLIILRDTPLNPCERPVKHHYHSRYTTSLTSNPNQARDIHLTSPHHIPPSLLSDGPLSIPLSAPSQPSIQCVRIHTHNLPDPTLWNALFQLSAGHDPRPITSPRRTTNHHTPPSRHRCWQQTPTLYHLTRKPPIGHASVPGKSRSTGAAICRAITARPGEGNVLVKTLIPTSRAVVVVVRGEVVCWCPRNRYVGRWAID